MRPKRVLAILGSPHIDGATATMLNHSICEAETAAFPKPRLSGKKYVLLTACNTPAPFSWIFGQSRGAIRNMDEFFKTAGMKSMGKIVCANTGKTKNVPERVLRKIERCWK